MPPPSTADGQQRKEGGFNLVALLLQAGIIFYLYQTFGATRGRAAPPPPPPGLQNDGLLAQISSSSPPPAAAPAPVVVADGTGSEPREPLSPGSNLFAMFGIPDPTKLQSTGVPRELARYEAERLASLRAVPPQVVLRNLWPNGQGFDLLVFASTDPSPVTDFSALAGVYGPGVSAVGEDALAPPESAPKATSLSLLGGVMQRLISSQAGLPRRYLNKTFDAFARDPPSTAEAEEEGEPSTATPPQHTTVLLWAQRELSYDWAEGAAREQTLNILLPRSLLQNASGAYAHIYFVASDAAAALRATRDWTSPRLLPPSARVIRLVAPLVVYLNKKPAKATYSLLGEDPAGKNAATMAWGIGAATAKSTALPTPSELDDAADANGTAAGSGGAPGMRVLPYWRPSLSVELIHDFSTFGPQGLPPHMAGRLDVQVGSAGFGYTPVAWVNTFWVLGHHLIPLNGSTQQVPLTLSYATAPMWKWAMQVQMTSQWAMQESMGGSREGETDMIKSILLETNPILLGVTVLVSTLHMVFEFLAFKNDVSFWRTARSMEGVSVRTLALSAFSQLVILLYLFDNETSYMVLISATMGVAIEFWKLRKAVSISIKWVNGWPALDLKDVEVGYTASRTKEYDEIAMSHLLYAVYPLIMGYAGYSLLYERHRSWWSWAVTSLTGFIYTFGFIQMTPQLYINYRLKSTVALPFRPLVYKALNTVIDDLFAFVVVMPTMHRLACFRDDVIFLIMLYQRWIYPVDKSRRNEFGATGEDYEAADLRKAGGGHRAPRRGKYEKRALPVPVPA